MLQFRLSMKRCTWPAVYTGHKLKAVGEIMLVVCGQGPTLLGRDWLKYTAPTQIPSQITAANQNNEGTQCSFYYLFPIVPNSSIARSTQIKKTGDFNTWSKDVKTWSFYDVR